jgi:homoserine dehydrogenase
LTAIHVALLGYGTVGKGVYRTVQKHQERLKTILGKEVKIVAILVKEIEKHHWFNDEILFTDNYTDIINLPKLDVVIDAIVGVEPGYTYLQQAIDRGCHVITANKEMFAHHGSELLSLAKEKNVSLGFEATVAGGIPIIQTLKKLLNANKVDKVEGILNGTSNFILTKMREDNLPFEEALKLAQENGYAEADPANDIDGVDAFYKAVILSEVIFGEQPEWEKTYTQGIGTVTLPQIKLFESLGFRFKHVASLQKSNTEIQCTVRPVLVTNSHPLFQVEEAQNAINIEADIVGNISLQGPGAGMFPTASAIVEDLIHIGDNHLDSCPEENLFFEQEVKENIWALHGEIDNLPLTDDIRIKKEIHPHVLLVETTDEEILHLRTLHGICCFEVLGNIGEENAINKDGIKVENISPF